VLKPLFPATSISRPYTGADKVKGGFHVYDSGKREEAAGALVGDSKSVTTGAGASGSGHNGGGGGARRDGGGDGGGGVSGGITPGGNFGASSPRVSCDTPVGPL